MGSLIKQRLAAAKGWDPSHVYHVTVMPCYDKKLEASRDDFNVPGVSMGGWMGGVCARLLHHILSEGSLVK